VGESRKGKTEEEVKLPQIESWGVSEKMHGTIDKNSLKGRGDIQKEMSLIGGIS